ncbi:hypothetical protein DKG74_18725 [Zavarzinia aquatilis]|uniref:SRPBCC family protein n=2 Tax=Zavarzinia aquatilis TaxID=2211142 RepID=A0A317DZN6_9PROT|nr:hypothetical protein DKG74_18725 [Zavarzinia aquatilis]
MTVTIHSEVAAPPRRVWDHVSTFAGVNDELAPLLRMTHPPGRDILDDSLPLNRPLFRSWLLLFGVVPVDYDLIGFAALVPEKGFSERSSMASLKLWHHDRALTPVTGGCAVTDTLAFVPRMPGTGRLAAALVAFLFRHRHRRLARRFGALGPITVKLAPA